MPSIFLWILFATNLFHLNKANSAFNDWTYENQIQWVLLNPSCGQSQQSPIEIYDEFCDRADDLTVELVNFDMPYNKGKYYWKNDGHTYCLTKENYRDGHHLVTGSVLNGDFYAFRQLHMHWNKRMHSGSEHAINGEKYALELHYVNEKIHRDNDRNQIVVLSSLFRLGAHNPFFDDLISHIIELEHQGQNITLHVDNLNKSIAHGLPKDRSRFYTYDGSLTTPSCDETVKWIIFKEIQEISDKQLTAIRLHHQNKDNIRKPQLVNHRLILDVNPNGT